MFFAATKLFQAKDPHLRRMVYLLIKVRAAGVLAARSTPACRDIILFGRLQDSGCSHHRAGMQLGDVRSRERYHAAQDLGPSMQLLLWQYSSWGFVQGQFMVGTGVRTTNREQVEGRVGWVAQPTTQQQHSIGTDCCHVVRRIEGFVCPCSAPHYSSTCSSVPTFFMFQHRVVGC